MRPILSCLVLSALASAACGVSFQHPAAQVSSPTPATPASAASAPAAPPTPPPGEPSLTFDAALARELPALPKVALELPDVAYRARVEAAGAPTITRPNEGVATAKLPLGPGIAPITCIWNRTTDTASMMMMLEDMGLDVDRTAIRYAHMAVAGQELVHSFAWVYRTREAAPKTGLLKIAVVPTHDDGLLMCQHDEVGYVQTFRRIVTGMVKDGGSTGEQESVPFWEGRYAIRLGAVPLGALRIHLSEHPEAPRRGWANMTLLVPDETVTTLKALGVTSVTNAGKDGVVTEHSFLTVVSGKPMLQVTATRTAAGTYRVAGHVGERPVDETKKLAADALFGKTAAKGPTLAFQPTHEEPTRFEERKEREIPGGTVFAGGVAIRKDERGMPHEIDVPLGGGVTAKATLEIERGDASALHW